MECKMKKKPIESFIEKHGLVLELDVRCNKVIAMLYRDSDLLISSFEAPTMEEAINAAVNNYQKENKCH